MPRTPTDVALLLRLDPRDDLPLYRQIAEQVRAAIHGGRLRTGARLPSTRSLAGQCAVARNTVKLAYEQLLAEGYLETRAGSSTCVAAALEPAPARHAQVRPPRRAGARAVARRLAGLDAYTAPAYPPHIAPSIRAFRVGLPALDRFPLEAWARIAGRRWRNAGAGQLGYADPRGDARLREAIATHIGASRGVRCTADRILVVSGSQEALDLISRVMLDPGDAAWVEDPGYFGARGAAFASGARLIPVPVDEEGLDVAAGRRSAPRARLAFVTPSHQFPLGVTLSLARRLALLAWAEAAGAWVVEDDYDSEFRYDARPLMSLQGLDEADRVLYVGTFSKTLFPALRLGYLVLPEDLIAPFVAARSLLDHHGPTLDQLVLADFLAEGHYARHLRRMRATYKERQDVLVRSVRDRLAGRLAVRPSEAGMHVVGWLGAGLDETRVAREAAARNVAVLPLASLRVTRGGPPGILLGYGATPPSLIRESVAALDGALQPGRPARSATAGGSSSARGSARPPGAARRARPER